MGITLTSAFGQLHRVAWRLAVAYLLCATPSFTALADEVEPGGESARSADGAPVREITAVELARDDTDTDAFHFRQGVVASVRNDLRALIENLEAIDLDASPPFANRDRAAFLLARGYLEAGNAQGLADLAESVMGWPNPTIYTRWVVNQYLLAQARHAPEQVIDLAERWGAVEERTGVAEGDSAVGTVTDALAASLLLRNGRVEEAHRLIARLRPAGDDAYLLSLMKAVTAQVTDRDADALLRTLAKSDTTTVLGRDVAAAARIQLAERYLERGRTPIPILSFVSARSRYASRASHIMGMYLIEHGDPELGAEQLRRVLETDPNYPARREVLLALAGRALERRALDEAGALYDMVDESWLNEQRTLASFLNETPADSLWDVWRRTARASDVLLFETIDGDRLAELIVSEVLLDLGAELPRSDEELEYLPPADPEVTGGVWPPRATTPTPSLGIPLPADRLDVEDAAARVRAATYSLERLGWDLERERQLLEQKRSYLGRGLSRTQAERELLEARDAELDEVMAALDALVSQLASVRDAALQRIARRTTEMLDKSRAHLATIRAFRRFQIEGPNLERAEPVPEETPSPGELLAEEETLAEDLLAFADAFATRMPEIIRQSHDEAWTPALVAEAARLSALAKDRLQWARRIEGDIATSLDALDGARVAELRAEIASAEQELADASVAYDQVREKVARTVVDRALREIERKREAVDYGLATIAYVRAISDERQSGLTDETRRASREEALARLQRFYADYPETPAVSEIRFHLADMLLADAKARFQREMQAFMERQERGEPVGQVPLVDYGPALSLYLAILSEDPDFPHRDAVLYNAGMILADEGESGRSYRLLSELVETYPESPFIQETRLKIGDLHFDDKRYAECVAIYELAAEGDNATFTAIALYKLGWAEFNRDRFVEAADGFRRLLDLYDSDETIELNTDLRPEAEDYFIHSLVRAGGASAYSEYFGRVGKRPYQKRVLQAMGQLLRRYSLFGEAIEVDRLWLAENPTDPDVLLTVERLIDTYDRWEKPDRARELRLEFAPAFMEGSQWYAANPSDSLRAAGHTFTTRSWELVALHHHQEARAGHDVASNWRSALDLYGTLLRHSPGDPERIHLQAGEAAFNLHDHQQSIAHYTAAASSDSLPLARAAEWQRVAVSDAWYESTRPAGADSSAVGADSLATGVALAVDRYVARFGDDPRSADLRWRKAGLAFAHGWHAATAASYSDFVDHHPTDERAPRAAALAADALHHTGDYGAAADAYERALGVASAAGADSLAQRIDRVLPGVRLQHAEAVEATAGADPGEVAFLFESIARRWPDFEHAATCQYRAGLAYLADGDVARGLDAMETIISRFPECAYVKDAHLQIIATCEAEGLAERAATSHLRFADAYPDDENAGDAILRASDIFAQAGRAQEAERLRLRYIDTYPNDVETAMSVLSELARRDLASAVGNTSTITALVDTTTTRSHLAHYLELAKGRPDLADPAIGAEVRFREAELTRRPYADATLTQPLEASIETKNARLEALIGAYRACAEVGVKEWSHAAAYRIGEALIQFGEALEKSERPPDLDGDDLYAYEDVLFEQAWTFYDRGEDVWTELLKTSGGEEAEDSGGWLTRARTRLWSRLGQRFLHRPELEYPLVHAVPPENVEAVDGDAVAARETERLASKSD